MEFLKNWRTLFIKLICGYILSIQCKINFWLLFIYFTWCYVPLLKTELNLSHFYTNPNLLLALWKDLAELNQKQLEILKNVLFGEVMREINIWQLSNQYIFTWKYGQMYVHMTSSKFVRTRHRIRRFPCRSLVLKIHPNPCQTPGTTAEGKKKNMANSEGAPF